MNDFPRRIRTDGAYNLRDLGGFAAAGGRVRTGMVFRADDLSELSRRDLEILAGLKLRTVVDFRGVGETMSYPDRVPATVTSVQHLPIDAGRVVDAVYDGNLNARKARGMMVSVYRTLVADFRETYRRFFEILSDPDSAPLLFHCTAGKDRTGVGAALFLAALGVAHGDIVADYLLSSDCLAEKFKPGVDYDTDSEPLYNVYPEFIEAAFETMDHEFGGVLDYLDRELGVDRKKLVGMYVEPEHSHGR